MISILVIKRDGSEELFDVSKVSESIMGAAMSVGGEDADLAEELSYKVLDILESNDISEITAEELQKLVENTLINEGHATTARQYILRGADRKRIRELDNSLIHSFEELTFKSEEESNTKRENANIDSSTSMGTMLKYGSEAAKSFNLSYLISQDIAEAHRNCDIHIHDLDFYSLTTTCVSEDTNIIIKLGENIKLIKISQIENLLGITAEVDVVIDISDKHLQVMSHGKFVNVETYCKRSLGNRKMFNIRTKCAYLNVTEDHKIPIKLRNKDMNVVQAHELKVGNNLMYPQLNVSRYELNKIDLIELFDGNENIIIKNTDEVIQNIRNNGKWKEFCSFVGYHGRGSSLRNGNSYLNLVEFKSIEYLTTIDRTNIKLAYRRIRQNTYIPAVLELTAELGRFMGLMFSEGSATNSVTTKQDSAVKHACFCNYDMNLIENFNMCAKTILKNVKLSFKKQEDNITGILLPGYLVYELFHGPFGIKNSSGDMSLPLWAFTANKDFIAGLIGGYLDGDGCIQKDGYRITLTSACKSFLEQMQYILLLRGVGSEITTNNTKGTETVFDNGKYGVVKSIRNYDSHRLIITGNLSDNIGWTQSIKVDNAQLSQLDKDENKYREVVSIEEVKNYTGYVYDISTEDHYFDANGIVVHNCNQIPIDRLFKGGFNTGHGFLREPGGIKTAGALTAIALQSDQNDQHGGQSIPMLDYYLAPYVALSYVSNIAREAKSKFDLETRDRKEIKRRLKEYWSEHKSLMNDVGNRALRRILLGYLEENSIEYTDKNIDGIFKNAYDDTYDETFQSMEAIIHNLNTMHCLPESEKIWVFDTKINELYSISMGDLYNRFEENRFKVISLNKGTGKAELKFITYCKKMGNNRNIVSITDNQGRTVKVTDNHRLMTIKNMDITENTPDKCEYTISPRGLDIEYDVSTIDVNKYGKPRRDNPFQGDTIKINEKFAEFIGYYMADGCMLGETSTCCISACGKVTFEYMENLLEEVFECKLRTSYTYFNNSKNGTTEKDIRIQVGMPLARMIKDKFGRVGSEKHIPTEFMLANKDVKKAFLKAYFLLDGRKDSNYAELSTVNKELQAQVALMISSLGGSSHYTTRECSDGFDNGRSLQMHFITLGAHDAVKVGVKDKINTKFEIPKYTLENIYDRYRIECSLITNRLSENLRYTELEELIINYGMEDAKKFLNFFVNKIESKQKSNSGMEYVYDISVEDNENFLTYECIYVHNSRAGAQVPFSSVNYGTDTSTEGRMVMETILKTTWDGLGNGETPIFPIQIFKMRKGVNLNPGDPNYDLFKLACKVSARRLYPNFVNLDAPYNAELYVEGHPETEMATMGCRTRVGKNVHDENQSVIPGRGNLSFTSINLPRLGIRANKDIDLFFRLLDEQLELVHGQLLERFELICRRHPLNYPFLMGQGCWLGSERLGPTDDIREVLKHGTLTVGFIGLAETLVALIGKHHGESEEAQQLGLKIIQHMRDYTDAWSANEHMNYSVIGTPAEGLSGRFVRADKKLFGNIPGVTDKDYYTNSSHIPVWFPISAKKKIDIEAPYHAIENGGHILYIEMDGDPTTNLKAFEKVIKYMHDKNAGYMSVNHAVDRDPVCQYVGIINDVCPRCGRRDGEPMTMEMWNKIKGFANAGNADTLGYHGDNNEEADRLHNGIEGL